MHHTLCLPGITHDKMYWIPVNSSHTFHRIGCSSCLTDQIVPRMGKREAEVESSHIYCHMTQVRLKGRLIVYYQYIFVMLYPCALNNC